MMDRSKENGWIRLHARPREVRIWDREHCCDSEGDAVENFKNFSPSRIKYLREKSYERYKKTEDGKYLDSIRITGEVGRVESIRLVEIGGRF